MARKTRKQNRQRKTRGGRKCDEGEVANDCNANPPANTSGSANAPAVNGSNPSTPAVNPSVNGAPTNSTPPNTSEGGRRKGKKTRKMAKGASNWNKQMMMVYHEMKKKNKNIKLRDAMKEASRRKKRGEL